MTLMSMATALTISLSLSTGAAVTPRITGVAPPTVVAGPNPQQLTVIGEGFMKGLTLVVSSPTGASQVYKDVEVQSQEEASFRVSVVLPVTGVYQFVVTNTDGGVSQPFRYELRGTPAAAAAQQPAAPVISGIAPASVSKQPQPQSVEIQGRGFAEGLSVIVNDPVGGATRVSGGAITNFSATGFTMTAPFTIEGEYTISVTNPDRQSSNSMTLSVRGAQAPVSR